MSFGVPDSRVESHSHEREPGNHFRNEILGEAKLCLGRRIGKVFFSEFRENNDNKPAD